jgi:uncharacterized protein YceK
VQRSAGRASRAIASGLVIAVAAGLSGCASISEKFASAASQMPGIGLPAGAPERAAQPTAFPAVHDMPPPRNSVTLTNTEQAQMERDLMLARDEQQIAAGVETRAKKKAGTPAPVKLPTSSRAATIY